MFFEKKEEDGGTNYLKVKPVFFQYASKSVRKWKAIPVPFQKKIIMLVIIIIYVNNMKCNEK